MQGKPCSKPLLIYMTTLIELCESGVLVPIDPLEDGEQPWRTLYATQDFVTWLDNSLPEIDHNDLYSDLTPVEQVFAVFHEYVSGETFSDDRRFKKLNCNPDLFVWEFKTDEVRIFGWVPRMNSFICCFGDSKDDIETMRSYQSYIARTNFVRTNIDLDEPKCVEGGSYSDVISNED